MIGTRRLLTEDSVQVSEEAMEAANGEKQSIVYPSIMSMNHTSNQNDIIV